MKINNETLVLLTVIFICLLISPSSLYAQNKFELNKSRHKIGFLIGKGDQKLLSVEYEYKILLVQLEYYYSILRKPRSELEIFFQPQYNFSECTHSDINIEKKIGYEIGLNAGLLFRTQLANNIMNVYTGIGSGPSYTKGIPNHQAKGFSFSNILFVGFNIKLFKNLFLDLRSVFRHLSNAGIVSPNYGINNIIYNGGILIEL